MQITSLSRECTWLTWKLVWSTVITQTKAALCWNPHTIWPRCKMAHDFGEVRRLPLVKPLPHSTLSRPWVYVQENGQHINQNLGMNAYSSIIRSSQKFETAQVSVNRGKANEVHPSRGRRCGALIHATETNLPGIMLCVRSQTEKDIYCMMPFM